jgi:hypothetical protein
MNSKFSKILTIVVAVISVIGIALFANAASIDKEEIEALNSAIDPLIFYSTYLVYAAVVITIVLSIIGLVKNPENLKKTLLGLAIMGVLLIVSYILGDSDAVLNTQGVVLEGGEAGASSNQWVGSLIWYSLILVVIGGAFFVYDLLKGLVKS